MHLKEAREKGKLVEFAKEHQKKFPPGNAIFAEIFNPVQGCLNLLKTPGRGRGPPQFRKPTEP
jgi:hypothetical protein